MTHFLVLIDVGYRKKDTRLLNVAKLIIDCRAEHKHLRRQIHIGVDKRRDIDAMAPDMAVENLIVLAECRPCEDVTHLVFVDASIERMQRIHEAVVVVKIFVKKNTGSCCGIREDNLDTSSSCRKNTSDSDRPP